MIIIKHFKNYEFGDKININLILLNKQFVYYFLKHV